MPGTAGPTTTHLPQPTAPPGPGATCHQPLSTTIPGQDTGTLPATPCNRSPADSFARERKASAGTGPGAVPGPGSRALSPPRYATDRLTAAQARARRPASDTATWPGRHPYLADPAIGAGGTGLIRRAGRQHPQPGAGGERDRRSRRGLRRQDGTARLASSGWTPPNPRPPACQASLMASQGRGPQRARSTGQGQPELPGPFR